MKLRLLSLVLLGITLLDVTQARTIEKKEVNDEDPYSVCSCNNEECNRCDDNGCEQVSNCNGKREASKIDYAGAAELLEMFKADNSKCKCLNHGYCLEREPDQKEYTEVTGCGERKCYTHCDPSGCREVCDGQCKCERIDQTAMARCEECDDKGCKQVRECKDDYSTFTSATNCTECDNKGCGKAKVVHPKTDSHGCNRLCYDDTDDTLLQDKCVCKKDENGKEKCKMCDKYRCNPVTDCSRFATCTLDHRVNTYRRCYGYNHGERYCRKMYSAVEFKKRDEQWEKELNANSQRRDLSCECPSNGVECKLCSSTGACYIGHPRRLCSNSDVFYVTAHLH